MNHASVAIYDDYHLLLRVPHPEEVIERIAGSWLVKGGAVVPWTLKIARYLSSLEVPVISRIAVDYDWPSYRLVVPAPMRHQVQMSDFLVRHRRAFLFGGIGTGKTLSTLWAFDYLRTVTPNYRMLVICPLSIVNESWGDSIKTHFRHLSYSVLVGTAKKRAMLARKSTSIHIINFDGVAVIEDILRSNAYDVVVVDEGTALKNATTRRWKAANRVIHSDAGIWLLTGTPTPQGPMDAYGQAKLLGSRALPKTTMQWKMQTMVQVTSFKWVPRKESPELVKRVLSPALMIDKRKVMADLPPVTNVFRQVAMTAQQKRALSELFLRDQVVEQGARITAANAAVRLIKALQVAAGCVYDDDGEVVQFDNTPRINELIDFIEQSASKTVVYVPYRHVLAAVLKALEKRGFKVAVVHGGVGRAERERIFKSFQTTDEYGVLLAIPNAMAHGVTATAASTCVWFLPQSRNEIYTQASGRVDRKGQKLPVTIAHIYGHAVEKQLYEAQQSGVDYERKVLALYQKLSEQSQGENP